MPVVLGDGLERTAGRLGGRAALAVVATAADNRPQLERSKHNLVLLLDPPTKIVKVKRAKISSWQPGRQGVEVSSDSKVTKWGKKCSCCRPSILSVWKGVCAKKCYVGC